MFYVKKLMFIPYTIYKNHGKANATNSLETIMKT